MSRRPLDAGAAVAAGGAVLLLISLFLDWYGDDGHGYSAWTLFEVIDLLLAAIALIAISTFRHFSAVAASSRGCRRRRSSCSARPQSC